jgi:hypothetical protein
MKTPQNDYQATVLALHLALTAEGEEKVDRCVNIAASFGLSDSEMDRAKRDALAMGDA